MLVDNIKWKLFGKPSELYTLSLCYRMYAVCKRIYCPRSSISVSSCGALCLLQADELEYAFKRLVDGLAHTREAARPGFSLALGQVSGDDYQNKFKLINPLLHFRLTCQFSHPILDKSSTKKVNKHVN